MKITYTGKHGELPPQHQKKLDAKFVKIGKLLDGKRGEKEAHVILSTERHLTNAEITVNYYDHAMVGVAGDADPFSALCSAVEKLEKQILKQRAKWRDTTRTTRNGVAKRTLPAKTEAVIESARSEAAAAQGRVFRVSASIKNKPMTVEEAVIEIDENKDYLVYRDAESDRISVLLRRKDGNFDLIEG